MRFHRPDFRTSLPEIIRHIYNHLNESEKGFRPNFQTSATSRLVLNLGRNCRAESDKNPLTSKTNITIGESYAVKGLAVSNVLRKARYQHSNISVEGSNSINALGSVSQATNSRRFSAAHPADLIEKPEDLTITDTLSIALLEYSEQSPPLLHNLGMALQITKFYRPISENMTLQQAQKKVRDRLGRFGPLKLAESYIPFFSSQMKLAKNQGVVVGESRLFKAPLFPHPTNPHSPLKIDETRATASKYGTGRFHDFRATDFLLIRKKIALESGQWGLSFSLRPIFLESIHDSSSNDIVKGDDGNLAACTLYTVGQTQPLIEVPSPRSKKCFEIRRDWLRTYALRLARQGITDFHTVKSRCLAKFGDIFEPSVLQKHLLSCRDNVSLTTPSTYSGQGFLGVNIRVVSEDALRSICSPEIICGLESSLISDYHLSEAGVMILRSPDRISSSVRELEADETFSREQLSRAKKLLFSHTERYRQLIQTLNANDTLRQLWEKEEKTVNQNISSFCDIVCGKRCSPIARLIEEMLLLTPWNITHNYIDIVSRHGAQLALDGIGDPSGGRGEGISLIRANHSTSGVHLDGGPSGKSNDTPKEDLRKLSMRELHDRLVKFGFESDIVKSLPRWDQVALVRTFQYDNMNSYGQEKTQKKLGRLSNEQYIKRINEIFMNQRLALAPDEPQLTLSDSDSLEKTDDFANNENQPIPNSDQGITVKSNVQTKEEGSVASVEQLTEKKAPIESNLEDELLSGLQSRHDQNESDHSTNSQNMELTERKALEDFRESLSKARQTNETDISPRLVEKFTPRELQFLQAKPIPRLVWIRKKKDSTTDQVKSEKIVHIYGYENIQLFYEWRRKQEAEKKYYNKQVLSSHQSVLGTASRTCRRCGQIGHISSNPICSLYTGRRKPRVSQNTSTYTGGTNCKAAYRGTPGYLSSDEDQGYDNESISSKHTLGKSLSTKRSRLTSSAYADVDSSEPNYKVLKQSQGHDSDSQFSKGKDTEDNKIMSSGPKLPTRTTARQRLILENKGALAGIAVQTYQGTYENAVNEINQIFQRVISKTDRDKRKWAVFREKISETDAPGYNTVITNPIWLNKMIKKCKAREYRSTATFLSDVQLLVDNCFRYNPPGHWIRPLVQSLGDFLREETESQGPWLVELDRFIQQYCQENVDAN
ncbi:transcription initiation factor TFIID subunit 1-like [Hylaeus volcanicus]|uniref:transcription initiation factor TFIID subunit 1-like n=1 Tax=Hylaeus volcanicus TaxID=313075 RepID=UPI0023B78D37|nr:transcription initiation factor TFIID subunit 1-like [Hylaeus volcanicus]XP_053990958.1 transcription initiation factor TFIID subunit 1-like [Hylaeus volcanicus]